MFSVLRKSLTQVKHGTRFLHGIKFQPTKEDRYDEVLDHLRSAAYMDTPIYKAAGLVGTGSPPIELDNVYLNSLKEGVSLIALNNNKLAGVIINGILTPDAVPEAIEAMKKSHNEGYKKLDYMFLQLLIEMDIFNRFGIQKALECRLISTTREYRGTGLGKAMVEKLTEIGRNLDMPLIVGEAVNNYLWKLLVSEGWIMVREMPYADYIDEVTQKPIFHVEPPHHILGVCVKILKEKCTSKDPLPLPAPKIIYPAKLD